MLTIPQTEDLFAFVAAWSKDPRISVRKLHNKYSHYKNKKSTNDLVRNARKERILFGPKIWCNSGFDLEFYDNIDDPLLLLESLKARKEITYINALIGHPSVICFKNGASIVEYAEAVIPTFPASNTIENIFLERKGKLEADKYPHGWSDFDWGVYHNMRDPSVSFVDVGQIMGVSWQTVKDHYKRILRDCKVWISLFPKGYGNYQQSFVFLKTKYELGLRDELMKFDRTTFIYKFQDKLLLHLFLDELLDVRVFYVLKRKGKVHDLHAAIPLEWSSQFW